ncbi:CotO family spore coat protein [Thalassobacillus hwangdonensis]|uniref:CotO family spore coat protein n=1 Tax=Thalassobacillus hwangdonensis TaxID=546108 RepID=A0ABW3KWF6_9BACI
MTMDKQKQRVKDPMLYIAQPKFDPIDAPMQSTYHGRKRNEKADQEAGRVEAEPKAATETEAERYDQQEEAPQAKSEPEEEKKIARGAQVRRQRFRDMSIEEKVNYFVHLPQQVPKMRCEVITEETSFRGYISDYEEGKVIIKTFKRPFREEVEFEQIKEIRLLGF